MRPDLQAVKRHVYDDGVIDKNEVEMLRGLVEKSALGEDEVLLLLDLNNVLSDTAVNPDFVDLMVDAVSAFVLDGGTDVDDQDAEWLRKNLLKDGRIDDNERRILQKIDAAASSKSDEFLALLNS